MEVAPLPRWAETPPTSEARPSRTSDPVAAPEIRAARILATTGWAVPRATVAPMPSGWSGMTAFRVTTPGASYHLKLSLTAPLPREQVADEIRNARFAAAAGLGPEVVWADVSAQALMTRLVVDVSPAHQQGGTFNAVVTATLRALRQLHETPFVIDRRLRTLAGADALAKVNRQIANARGSSGGGPIDLEGLRAYSRRLVARLASMPYVESLCHGDMNGCNSLFDGERTWIIDWTYLKLGDGLYELAYYGFHVGCAMPDTEQLLARYRPADVTAPRQLERLRAHLALLHVGRYAMRVTGMPWHDAAKRGEDLADLANRLHQDARQLRLTPPRLDPARAQIVVRRTAS